jgi:hypothetical protein
MTGGEGARDGGADPAFRTLWLPFADFPASYVYVTETGIEAWARWWTGDAAVHSLQVLQDGMHGEGHATHWNSLPTVRSQRA